MKLFNYVKAFALPFLLFLAVISIGVAPGGTIVLHLPALATVISHADLYGAGLLVVFEIFLRAAPTEADASLLTALSKFLDIVVPNRYALGGFFGTASPIVEPHQAYRGAAV